MTLDQKGRRLGYYKEEAAKVDEEIRELEYKLKCLKGKRALLMRQHFQLEKAIILIKKRGV